MEIKKPRHHLIKEGRNLTHTVLLLLDFEPGVSTNSATLELASLV